MLPNGKQPKNELHIKRPEYSHIITSYIYIHFYIIIFLHNRNFILFYFIFFLFHLFYSFLELNVYFLKKKQAKPTKTKKQGRVKAFFEMQ